MTKIPNFKNSRWRTAAILKMVLSLYLRFGVQTQIVLQNGRRFYLTKYLNFANSKWRTAAILKIVFWLYLNE